MESVFLGKKNEQVFILLMNNVWTRLREKGCSDKIEKVSRTSIDMTPILQTPNNICFSLSHGI